MPSILNQAVLVSRIVSRKDLKYYINLTIKVRREKILKNRIVIYKKNYDNIQNIRI